MNPEIKARWLRDLRSGEFKQGLNMLRNEIDNEYCCLGVLCKSADVRWSYYILKDEVGVSDKVQSTLMALNDEEKKSFTEIADWIEENL